MLSYIEKVIKDAYISEGREKELKEVELRTVQLIKREDNRKLVLNIILESGRTNNLVPDRVRRKIEYRLERNLHKHYPEVKFDEVMAVATGATYTVVEVYKGEAYLNRSSAIKMGVSDTWGYYQLERRA